MAFTEQKNEMIRKDLLDEALRCAVTVGMRKTSVEQLTEAVGIAKGSFYKVFPSKELLFFAVLENIHAETYAVAEKALQDNAELPPTERATKIILRGLILTVSHQGEIGELYPQVLETLVHGACKELFD